MNYYNEWDKHAAAWIRRLIAAGLIPPGDVDERSITDVKPDELTKYTQCHFFAGIGGWSVALCLAGWPADRPVGTGSCPCQPFSAAGKQLGNADERHLWPVFFRLIADCRALGQRWTDTIFGEQVESAIGHGWLDSVATDLEGEGYACGAAVLGAHSVGAPHRRQRLYFVADSIGQGLPLRQEQEKRPRNIWEQWNGREATSQDGAKTPWDGAILEAGRDGLRRVIKSEVCIVAHGFPARVGLLRGSGNAIVPQVAAQFIIAAEEARAGMLGGLSTPSRPLVLSGNMRVVPMVNGECAAEALEV